MKRKLLFKYVKFQNYMSFGKKETIFDYRDGSFNLITGNIGSGKSSLVSVISFCLFGKTDRKLPLGKHINSINRKNCVVEVHLDLINKGIKKKVIIRRGLAPNIQEIEVDGKPLPFDNLNEAVVSLLNLNINTFHRLVFLSPEISKSFYTLSKGEKEEFLNTFIDFDIIKYIQELNKGQKTSVDLENSRTEGALLILTDKLEELKSKLDESDDDNLKSKLDNLNDEKDKINDKILSYSAAIKKSSKVEELKNGVMIDEYSSYSSEHDAAIANIDVYNSTIRTKNSVISSSKKEIQKIESLDIKNEKCKEEINDKILKHLNNKIDVEVNKIETLENTISILSVTRDEMEDKVELIDKFKKTIDDMAGFIVDLVAEYELIKLKIENVQLQHDTNKKASTDLKEEISSTQDKIKDFNIDKVVNARRYDIMKIAKRVLNSKVNPYLLSKINPFLEAKLNYYFDLFEYPVIVSLKDGNGIFRSIGKPNFTYGQFSSGERRIIDLATTFAFKDLMESYIGVKINLFIFDEYITNLSIGELNQIIPRMDTISREKDLNMFIITHNPNIQNMSFATKYHIQKQDGFTIIKKEP